jgi:hypothetical protein
MTLGALVEAEPALDRLLDQKLSAQAAYHLAKLATLVRAETAHFHAQREALIREFGTPTGEVIEVQPDQRPEFFRRVQELLAVEATIAWRPLSVAQVLEISGGDVLRLGALLSE